MTARRIICGVLALLITVAICWRWDIGLLGSDHGIHGDGFLIFLVIYLLLYMPIALLKGELRRKK